MSVNRNFEGFKNVVVTYTLNSSGLDPLTAFGCHSRSLTNLSLTVSNILDIDKEIPSAEFGRSAIYIRAMEQAKKDFTLRDELFSKIVNNYSNTRLVIMSGLCNNDGNTPPTSQFHGMYSVGGFVTWLVDKKIGIVTASPILTNPLHQSSTDFSLLRGWFWIPPNCSREVIKGTGYIAEPDGLSQPFPEWMAQRSQILKPFELKDLQG